VLFFSRYIDYKFRTAAQVDPASEEKYYNSEFANLMLARGEKLPTLDSVRATFTNCWCSRIFQGTPRNG